MASEKLLSHCVSSETRNTCAMIHPALLPFVEQCLSNDALNTQGGILEVTKPRGRYGSARIFQSTVLYLYCYSALEFENGRCCDRFMLGIPYCGTQVSCMYDDDVWVCTIRRVFPLHQDENIFYIQGR